MGAPPVYSTPEDMYAAAQQAGIIQPDAPPPAGGSGEMDFPEDYVGAPIGPTVRGERGRPGVMGGDIAPPDNFTPPEQGPQSSGSGSVSGRVSVSGKGFNLASYRKDPTDRDIDALNAETDARAQEQTARMLDPTKKADQEAVKAADEISHASVDKITEQGHQAELLKGHLDHYAADEAKANAAAAALSNQAKADYMAALADFRASRVDPGQLWNSHSGGEQFGMLMTAFVHDFLGARGIHTSAMDTLNKAIDRNIASQVEGIKVKGEVAAGFKTLWDMQRAQSASEAEARDRMHGIYLDAAKQQAISVMSRYDSALATAQGHAAVAAIDGKSAEQVVKVFEHIDNNTTALRKQNLDQVNEKRKAAIEAWKADIAAKKEAREGKDGGPNANLLPDVSPSGGGFARYEFRNSKDNEGNRKTAEQMGGLASFERTVDHARMLMREVSKIPPGPQREYFLSTNQKELLEVQQDLAQHAAVAIHGTRPSTDLINMQKEQFVLPDMFKERNPSELLERKIERVHEQVKGAVDPFITELAPNDPRRKIQVAPGNDSFMGQAEKQQAHIEGHPVTDPAETERKKLEQGLGGPQSTTPMLLDNAEENVTVKKDHAEFVAKYPELATKTSGDSVVQRVGSRFTPEDQRIKQYEVSLSGLKDKALSGDEAAIASLYEKAKPFLDDPTPIASRGDKYKEDPEAVYATMMLVDLGAISDPAKYSPTDDNRGEE